MAKKKGRKETKKLKKEAKKARKREKKAGKRAAKRARKDGDARSAEKNNSEKKAGPQKAGLEIRSRETVTAEKAAEDTRRAEERQKEDLAMEKAQQREAEEREREVLKEAEEKEAAIVEATTETRAELTMTRRETTAAPPDTQHGAAMTMEQYRAMANAKSYMRGTTHATEAKNPGSADGDGEVYDVSKTKKGFWACVSYKCGKGGVSVLNPKHADRCSVCGSMKTLNAGKEVWKHGISDAQYVANQSRRRGK